MAMCSAEWRHGAWRMASRGFVLVCVCAHLLLIHSFVVTPPPSAIPPRHPDSADSARPSGLCLCPAPWARFGFGIWVDRSSGLEGLQLCTLVTHTQLLWSAVATDIDTGYRYTASFVLRTSYIGIGIGIYMYILPGLPPSSASCTSTRPMHAQRVQVQQVKGTVH
jgi:hypothetical protein